MVTVSNSELAAIGNSASNLDYTARVGLLREMDDAMKQAKQYSMAIDEMLKDALYKGGPSKEMIDKMTEIRSKWSAEMARHRKAYKLYHNLPE